MPKGMYPIYSRTISTPITTVTFNNIPQDYTDLLVKTSLRSDLPGGSYPNVALWFNGSSSTGLFSNRHLYTLGGGVVGSDAESGAGYNTKYYSQRSDTTTNTFSVGELYIPNYSNSTQKQFLFESMQENDSSAQSSSLIISMCAGLYRGNSPVTSISFAADGSTANMKFVAGSTFSIYGISK